METDKPLLILLLNNMKNMYIYWYYECYLQIQSWYKDYELKKIYGVCVLIITLSLSVYPPLIILYGKIFRLSALDKYFVGIISLVFVIFTFYIIGKGDITERLNNFYKDKKQLKKAKFNTKITACVCLFLWIFAIFYKYGEL